MAMLLSCAAAPPSAKGPISSQQIKALASQEAAAGHTEQAGALEDGVVTPKEYDDAFKRLDECLTSSGFTVTAPLLSPVNGSTYEYLANFGAREQSSALADLDECEAKHWKSVSLALSLSTPVVMAVPLRVAVAKCLSAQGLRASGEEASVADFVEKVPGATEDAVHGCVHEQAIQLYPEYPSLSIGR